MKRPWAIAILSSSLLCCTGSGEVKDIAGWETVLTHHARHFSIQKRGPDRLLAVLGPNGSSDTLALVHVGPGEAPHGVRSLGSSPKRIVVGSTTHLPYITALGAEERLAGAVHPEDVRDPVISARLASGAIIGLAPLEGAGREQLLALDPELFLTYPFGGGASQVVASQSLIVLPVAEYLEPHPLGRAEWLRFFGVLFGMELPADSAYDAIVRRYASMKERTSTIAGNPSVFFGSAWQGTWHVPGGDSYMAMLIADAGGRYRFAHLPGSENVPLTMEQVIQEAMEADHWGMVLRASEPLDASAMTGGDERLERFRAVRTSGLFAANSARSDLFGKALLEPDVVLADLVQLFHPELLPEHRPVYFRAVPQ